MPFVNNMSGKFGFGHPTVNTRGSARFNVTGTGESSQYLQIAMTAIGTSTATVEFWYYPTLSNLAFQRIVSTTTIGRATGDFVIWQTGSALAAGDGLSEINSSVNPSLNAWNHVAWVGTSGTSQEFFLNGSRVGTGGSYNLPDTTFYIGGRQISTGFFVGYLSNFRYVRNTAVYSGTTYTVPTEPLYPITGTELLLNTPYGANYLQDNSPNNYAIITHGIPVPPQSVTLNPF
jgi:hypothetical protein